MDCEVLMFKKRYKILEDASIEDVVCIRVLALKSSNIELTVNFFDADRNTILVDDYEKTIKEWASAGGTAILFDKTQPEQIVEYLRIIEEIE